LAQKERTAEKSQGRREYAQLVGIILVASILGIALALIIDWFPTQASAEAHKIDTLYDVLMICSVPFFVLVVTVVGFAVVKWRVRPGQELEDGPPIHGNTRLEVIWTAIPALILVSLCSYAYAVLHDIEKARANPAERMTVQVYGQQFAWHYVYPKAVKGKDLTTNSLYLPAGKQIQFDVHAKDVLHDFFVPAFRLKIDAVPGITTHFRATPTRLGAYPVVCAELCGLGHGLMRSTVHVVSQRDFNAWLARQKPSAGISSPPDPTP